MSRLCLTVLLAALVFPGCANVDEPEPPVRPAEGGSETDNAAAGATGETYQVQFETTAGDFVVEVHRDWSPRGADHFRELVEGGFYNDVAFFRAVKDFMVQFGISGDPQTNEKWGQEILDDPVVKSNKRGFITYAKTGAPNSRSTQVFINFKDNSFLDGQGFSPFGVVVGDGMEVVDSINQEYGEPPQDAQQRIKMFGNKYLQRTMPNLDYIKKATIISVNGEPVQSADAANADTPPAGDAAPGAADDAGAANPDGA